MKKHQSTESFKKHLVLQENMLQSKTKNLN